MTNASLKAIVADLGDKLCIIKCDNGEYILFGYPNTRKKLDENGKIMYMTDAEGHKIPVPADTITTSDIQYHSYGGEDFFSIGLEYTSQVPYYKYRVYHRTDSVQAIIGMEADYVRYRVDPMIL